ncbi:putative 2-hydroxychromene-2-carboxylate isomerase [Aspergillus homomorphus CBS 101889]|uniref:Glutathione S-transferase kappa n=1 Tax=Aspergillus homomorphus (strain CBS 101889) TaxID=1450537 RepID=A0A395HPZ4_ASPHC|nr:putative 2-hydroxychromene-2-carboxylate isomerase [Aspergillus homomorphus CBS 101889]RAL08928.1 putative 2-hydroxychromene-2-carboxylate isomerase [Aspergillus homomorphus CBS 101889]
MANPSITLYFDTVSPFGYIAFHVLRTSPIFSTCKITYVPIFLGGLMHACGNTPPVEIKNKDKWIATERNRWAKYFSVPIVAETPPNFPPRTLHTQRALCAVAQLAPEQLLSVQEALFRTFWVEGDGRIGEPACFVPVLEAVLGKEVAARVVEIMGTPEIKAQLAANTDRAFKAGAFGVPWLECTNAQGKTEGFFGVDHLGQVVDFLGLERGLDRGLMRALL